MKIKVEQFIRTKHGLDKIIKIDDEVDDTCGLIHLTDNTFYNFYIENGEVFLEDKIDYKVASIPQELIEAGDLVTYDTGMTSDTFIVTENVMEWIKGRGICIHKQWITKIYTPNEDKSQFTLQYSKEEK